MEWAVASSLCPPGVDAGLVEDTETVETQDDLSLTKLLKANRAFLSSDVST